MEALKRMTEATADVLRVLLAADDVVWGLAIIKDAGRPAGTVYPVLERLERAGWITGEWETDDARSGPRRRYYRLTRDGAAAAGAAVERRASARPAGAASRAAAVRGERSVAIGGIA
ncbi:PadR family transcriptional regulator [Agromyces seonyuensis]|uniref:PadR family transcriptional regulator n=1 Tax=Agromyces seonyuensis TaxID=2662446 RepID=A0A6I4P0T7_9MICO|nr:helix-turn-helix transcriptional regulator [Agromyces seonyuensis]MWB98345.1 PadR family transcriptional regulator [Agromyces seonyuensis]